MPAFVVTTNPTKLDPLKAGGKMTIVVTATNQLPRAVTARAQKVVDPPNFDALVKPPPSPQQTFNQRGETRDFPFTIEAPADLKAPIKFVARFDVVDVQNQDDNFGQSAGIQVVMEPPPPPPPPNGGGRPWWFWVLIGVGVLVLGVVLFLVLRPKGGMPDVTQMNYDSAQAKLARSNIQAVRADTLNTDTAWKANVVIRQHPPAGSKLTKETTADTLVTQVPFAVVPSLDRQKPDVAANRLGLAGLASNGVGRCTTDSTLNNLVLFTNPAGGALVPRTTTVSVYVGYVMPSCRLKVDRAIILQQMVVPVAPRVLTPAPHNE